MSRPPRREARPCDIEANTVVVHGSCHHGLASLLQEQKGLALIVDVACS